MSYDNWKTTNPADETLGSKQQTRRVYELPPGVCSTCDQFRGETLKPPHMAASGCESGKRDHCTCDVCF